MNLTLQPIIPTPARIAAALLIVFAMAPSITHGAELPYNKQTFTYKTAGQCKIHLDTFRSPGDDVRPVIFWIHGGALIGGHRGDISKGSGPQAQLQRFLDAGFVLVSIDYRLAPETKLKNIIEDVQDAHRWVHSKGPKLLKIDPNRMVVVGGSAGGYLTLMSGFCLNPRPKALVSFYGYGDIAGPWYSRPDPFYVNERPLVPKDEAYQAVDGPPVSEGSDNRFTFYLYCRQHGLWPKEVTGHDPDREPRAFDPWCPIRNVTKDYPPTMLLHGDKDTDVPYEQSVLMAAELKRRNIEHQFVTIPNGGHGFDRGSQWLKEPDNAKLFERVIDFMRKHTN